MFNTVGYSVYLSNFEETKERLRQLYTKGSSIFTSFHISEEMDATYTERAVHMCKYLNEIGYDIIADVSKKTLEQFQCASLADFAERMGIRILRIDYGFDEAEMIEAGKHVPIALNASTVSASEAERILGEVKEVYGMHNFYPRPETGLDHKFFTELNSDLMKTGVKVIAFIPGSKPYRGPLFETLPTLEEHRNVSPYAAYVDMKLRYGLTGIFVGDGIINQKEAEFIHTFDKDDILILPVMFEDKYEILYDREFTIRPDSPGSLKRISESREYSCFGTEVTPDNCSERTSGTITIDNINYQRYSGEIQIVIDDKPADSRVNVIGAICDGYEPLLMNIRNGKKIRFVKG